MWSMFQFSAIFQLLCCDRVDLDWDEKLDEKSLACWNSLLQGLESINSIEVPRCYFRRFNVSITSQQINGLKGQCHGSTAHPKYARTWKTVCQQLIKLGVKYDILFIFPSLCRTSLLCFKNWRLLHLLQSCNINFKRFFSPFILANQCRDTAPLSDA
jgi:hypothetical protein